MLLSNVSHLKEILVYLKPNNFPRYLEQLTDIESRINAVDATKYQHDVKRNRPVVEEKEGDDDNDEKEEEKDEVDTQQQEEENVVVVEEEPAEVPEEEKEEKEEKDEQESQDGKDHENSTTQSLGPTQPEVLDE